MRGPATSCLRLKRLQRWMHDQVRDPDRIVIPFDRIVPSNKEATSELRPKVREWTRNQEIADFFEIGEGICVYSPKMFVP